MGYKRKIAVQQPTLEELEENVRDAYRMMLEEQEAAPVQGTVESKEIEVAI